jgi:outer membrane protein assembly factor BamB
MSRLRVAWRFRFRGRPGPSGAVTASPVVAGGVVYVQDMNSDVFALELEDGARRWTHRFGYASPGPNGLAVAEGRVIGVTDTDVFALSAEDGRLLWSRPLVTQLERYVDVAPLVADGVVYASTIGLPPGGRGALYALDAATGRLHWRFSTIKAPWAVPRVAGGGGAWYPPSVADGTVYWGTANPYPYGGTRRYPNGAAFSGPALYTDSLVALSATNGELLWFDQVTPHDVRDYDFQLPPVVVGDAIFGAGKAGLVIAWDRRTHQRLWQVAVGVHRNDTGPLPPRRVSVCPGLLGGVETPMAYADRTLYVPVVNLCWQASSSGYLPLDRVDPSRGRGELVALDAVTGRERWARRFGRPLFGCATAVGGMVLTATLDGTVLGLDGRDGATLWRHHLENGVNACPSVAGDRLIVAAGIPSRRSAWGMLTVFALRS